ncbi:MAG: hypothetical protein GWP19_13125 [Planctomycetia bacterium]|nr:hypothetical protein [Planctomycetia bacterium]
MKNTIRLLTILCLGVFVLQAQDITNKLGGNTANETYDVTDSNDNVLFRVQGDGNLLIGMSSVEARLNVDGGTNGVAVFGQSQFGTGVRGSAHGITGTNYGGYFEAGGSTGRGVFGWATEIGDVKNYGGYFRASGNNGIGVYGEGMASGSATNYGGYFEASGSSGVGIFAQAIGAGAYAGDFNGDVQIIGMLSKSAGSFKIDHPLDPTNKNLLHSFVESPDMMNVYNGNIITDGNGMAYVELPDYFDALNKDFRYQLTVIGEFAQAIVFQKIRNNQFSIKTDKPDVEVSWQVTGIRQDAFANANRIQVEEYKRSDERGKYLHPEAFGQPREMSIDYRPEDEAEMKAMR